MQIPTAMATLILTKFDKLTYQVGRLLFVQNSTLVPPIHQYDLDRYNNQVHSSVGNHSDEIERAAID